MGTKRPKRVVGIPEEAVWNVSEPCWEHGPLDAAGKKHGLWRSWYASGTLRGEESFRHGAPHGLHRVVRGAKGESPFDDTFGKTVHRCEFDFAQGMLLRQRCFDRRGALVGSDGKPLPKRKPLIPADATYVAPAELWVAGPLDGHAPISGNQRLWSRDGQLLADLNWKEGVLHGAAKTYSYPDLSVDVGLPKGPPRTTRTEAVLANGRAVSARFFGPIDTKKGKPVETELAAVQFKNGKIHGRVSWLLAAHNDLYRPVFEYGNLVLNTGELLAPRRLAKTHRIEADFKGGKRTEVRAFDATNKRILPPPPVSAWGKETTRADLQGYITSGAFARDVAAFFPDAKGDREIDEDAERAKVVFAKLPETHRATALAFGKLVRKGGFPDIRACSMSGYGFDCVKNELYGAAEEKYFGIAYDAYGDLYLLDVETGRVPRWAHDRDPFEDGEEFESLDAFAWAMLRVELCTDLRIPAKELAATFKRLGFGWLGTRW